MILRDLIAAHPALFYPQTWYRGEEFLGTYVPELVTVPKALARPGFIPTPGNPTLPSVAQLAAAYVSAPNAPIWRWFLWTRDVDRHGQAVYVGGIGHDEVPGFQIHRHLTITNRWGIAA